VGRGGGGALFPPADRTLAMYGVPLTLTLARERAGRHVWLYTHTTPLYENVIELWLNVELPDSEPVYCV
jgi:hypothetical protein